MTRPVNLSNDLNFVLDNDVVAVALEDEECRQCLVDQFSSAITVTSRRPPFAISRKDGLACR